MSTPVSGTTQFKVTPESLLTGASDCTTTNSEIQTQLSALASYVQGLESEWMGTASNAFQLLMIEFRYNADLLNDALQEMAQALTQSAGNYSNSDSVNTKNLSSISGMMPGAGTANFT